MVVKWTEAELEEVHVLAHRVREYEVWLATPEGREAMAPYEHIKRLEAGNAKLEKKAEKLRDRKFRDNIRREGDRR